MSKDPIDPTSGFAQFEDDLRRAERKVAGEIDPGARAVVVAAAVLVAGVSLALPHVANEFFSFRGAVSGFDVLSFDEKAQAAKITITSRVFVYLLLIFGVLFSALALITRRWVLSWIALCGSMVSVVAGTLAWWTRNTPGLDAQIGSDGKPLPPVQGVGIGLVLGLIAVIVLSFHWARVVWARNALQLSLEAQRRDAALAEEERMRRLADPVQHDEPED
ncbi:MAG: hypothetical protein QM728_08270 [Gordonia sp. (in: high G+C Gram-positive bacteria)]